MATKKSTPTHKIVINTIGKEIEDPMGRNIIPAYQQEGHRVYSCELTSEETIHMMSFLVDLSRGRDEQNY